MDDKIRRRIQLDCLYDMFRDRIEENVIYIVYSENDGKIDTTIDQLMSISSCSFTGHHFEPTSKPLFNANTFNSINSNNIANSGNASGLQTNEKNTCKPEKTIKDSNIRTKQTDDNTDINVEAQDNDINLTIDERIERLQRSIDDLLVEKQTSHDKASQYLSKKMFPVTSYYSELASQIRRMIDNKTNEMVDLLLQKSQNSNCIDLHGLNPIQARLVVSELIKIRQEKIAIDKQGEACIDIITGWGKHSVSQGQHRVRPTIISFLRDKGIEYQYLNRGALRVTIRRC